jgi:hypothetical protein
MNELFSTLLQNEQFLSALITGNFKRHHEAAV